MAVSCIKLKLLVIKTIQFNSGCRNDAIVDCDLSAKYTRIFRKNKKESPVISLYISQANALCSNKFNIWHQNYRALYITSLLYLVFALLI